MNIFWVDTETTGLDPQKNSVVELACAVESDNVTSTYLHWNVRPDEAAENICAEALSVNGYTIDELMSFPRSLTAVKDMIRVLDPFVKNNASKFVIAGQNADFDRQFIKTMFGRNCCHDEFDRLFSFRVLDTSSIFTMLRHNNFVDVPSSSLETIAAYLGITYKAHNAIHDLSATMKAYRTLSRCLSFSEERL